MDIRLLFYGFVLLFVLYCFIVIVCIILSCWGFEC